MLGARARVRRSGFVDLFLVVLDFTLSCAPSGTVAHAELELAAVLQPRRVLASQTCTSAAGWEVHSI